MLWLKWELKTYHPQPHNPCPLNDPNSGVHILKSMSLDFQA